MAKVDEVKKALDVCINQGFGSKCHECVYREYEGGFCIDALMKDALDVINQMEVVRCKDCKHLNVLNRKEIYAHCAKTNTVFLPFELDTRTHYCSLAERKNND